MAKRGGRCIEIAQCREQHLWRTHYQGGDVVGLDPQAIPPRVERTERRDDDVDEYICHRVQRHLRTYE